MLKTTYLYICDGCGEEIGDENSSFVSMNINGNQIHLHSYDHLGDYGKKIHEEETEKKARADAEVAAMEEARRAQQAQPVQEEF